MNYYNMTVLTVIVFLMLIIAFVYVACIHEENRKVGEIDDILNSIDDNAKKNMVIKLQGIKPTPTERRVYKISDDTSKQIGDPGAIIQELESKSYCYRKWRASQEKEFKKARQTVLI